MKLAFPISDVIGYYLSENFITVEYTNHSIQTVKENRLEIKKRIDEYWNEFFQYHPRPEHEKVYTRKEVHELLKDIKKEIENHNSEVYIDFSYYLSDLKTNITLKSDEE